MKLIKLLPEDNSDLKPLRGLYCFDSWSEFWVILAFVLSCFLRPVSWHAEVADSLFRYLIALCLLISFNLQKWDRFKIFLVIFLLLSLVIRRWLVTWALFAMVYQIDYLRIPVKRLAAIGLTCLGFIILMHVILVLCGVWENMGVHYEKANKILYDLGSGNSNRIASLVNFSTLVLYILLKDKHQIWFPVISLTIGYIIFDITGSRTCMYTILIVNMLAVCYWIGLFWNWTRFLLAIIPVVLFVGTFYLAANMESNEELSESASGRLYYILKFTREFGTKEWLMGTIREDSDPLDSSYLDLIVTGGISYALFFCVGFASSIILYFRKVKSYIPFVLAFLAAGVSETYFSYPDVCSVILWIIVLQAFIKYKPVLK